MCWPGDNADRRSPVASPGTWLVDNITGGVARDVHAAGHREARSGRSLPSAARILLHGNPGNDRLYGESDTDTLKGDDGQDYAEGNQEARLARGERRIRTTSSAASAVAAQPDDGDYLHGGAHADVMSGDNAIITRDLDQAGRPVQLRDRPPRDPHASVGSSCSTSRAPAQPDLACPDQMGGGAGLGRPLRPGRRRPSSPAAARTTTWRATGRRSAMGRSAARRTRGAPPVIAALAASASPEPVLSGPEGA